jgi:hypothetical protein
VPCASKVVFPHSTNTVSADSVNSPKKLNPAGTGGWCKTSSFYHRRAGRRETLCTNSSVRIESRHLTSSFSKKNWGRSESAFLSPKNVKKKTLSCSLFSRFPRTRTNDENGGEVKEKQRGARRRAGGRERSKNIIQGARFCNFFLCVCLVQI